MTDSSAKPGVAERTETFSIGILLILLYGVFVALVVFSFSAYVIRTEWDSRLSNDGIADVDNLVFLIQHEQELTAKIETMQQRVERHDNSIKVAAAEVRNARYQLNSSEGSHKVVVALAESHVRWVASIVVERTDLLKLLEGDQTVSQASVEKALNSIPGLTFQPDADENTARENTVEHVLSLSKSSTELIDKQFYMQRAEDEEKRAKDARGVDIRKETEQQTALDEIHKIVPVNSEHRARWVEMQRRGNWNPMNELVALPTIILTRIATISAGALGTLVAYSRTTYIEYVRPRTSGLLIGLGEGIAAAIGVFLFAGAGMLVLSQGGGSNGKMELSPYTVAFLAFLSGFMAESAFARISKFGKDLFDPDKQGKKTGKANDKTPKADTAPADGDANADDENAAGA